MIHPLSDRNHFLRRNLRLGVSLFEVDHVIKVQVIQTKDSFLLFK